jgi:hypothetical protein
VKGNPVFSIQKASRIATGKDFIGIQQTLEIQDVQDFNASGLQLPSGGSAVLSS